MGITILVVEDSETQRLRLKVNLETHGMTVVLCRNGREALEAAHRHPPDVILSDVLMPEMDGFRMCREIQLDPELRGIPVVLRSAAFVSEEDQRFALSVGARAYIQKDTPPAELGFLLRTIAREPSRWKGAVPPDETFHEPYQERLLTRLVEEAARLEHSNEQLHESRARLQAILDNSPLFIYVKDREGRYLLVNEHFITDLGVTADEVIGRTDEELFGRFHAAEFRGNDLQVFEEGAGISAEESMLRDDGVHTYLSNKFPLRDPEGEITAVCGITVDITERERLEERLRRAEKMEVVGRLASGVAHDFNNLLTIVLNYVGFVYEELEEGDQRRDDLEQAIKASEKGRDLIRQLLTLSRRERGEVASVDIGAAIREMEAILRTSLGDQIVLSLDLEETDERVRVDPAHVDQILLNLAVNARDAMDGRGSVVISTSTVDVSEPVKTWQCEIPEGRYIKLSVSDEGAGMSRQTMEQIFEPFFTTKAQGSGTGLGLATVHGIVSGIGGYVTVDSEPNIGTRFVLFLPVDTSSADDAPVSAGETATREASTREASTILVVDDQAPLREIVRRMLSSTHHDVVLASSGEEALRVFDERKDEIDLVLTDVKMPGMTGVTLADELRRRDASVRVAYMSGSGSSAPDPILRKPFNEASLLAFVNSALGSPRIGMS